MRPKKHPRYSEILLDTDCDFCKRAPRFIIDAPSSAGPWAHMCPTCYQVYGVEGMGTEHHNLAGWTRETSKQE